MPCRDLLQTRGPPESPWHERRHNQLESSGGLVMGVRTVVEVGGRPRKNSAVELVRGWEMKLEFW